MNKRIVLSVCRTGTKDFQGGSVSCTEWFVNQPVCLCDSHTERV